MINREITLCGGVITHAEQPETYEYTSKCLKLIIIPIRPRRFERFQTGTADIASTARATLITNSRVG